MLGVGLASQMDLMMMMAGRMAGRMEMQIQKVHYWIPTDAEKAVSLGCLTNLGAPMAKKMDCQR